MCSGGSAPAPATIIMPDTNSYDSQLEAQMDAIRTQMDNQQKLLQQQLQSSLQRNSDLMNQLTLNKIEQANSPAAIDYAVAERFQTLQGPIEDLVAQRSTPSIISGSQFLTGAREKGASRESDVKREGGAKKPGKDGLRIKLTAPKKSNNVFGQGAGLNIT